MKIEFIKGIGLLAAFLMLFDNASAQNVVDSLKANRYVTRATTYGVGFTNVFDTYLSPQEYKGTEFRLARESTKMTKLLDGNISSQYYFQANIAYTHNKHENNNSFSGLFNWNYGLHYQFRLTDNFKLLAGGLLDINGGFIYNLRNSNNPASAKAYLNFDASGMAIWHLKIKKYPLTLRYQINVPLGGVMFSPNYGQSYYDIFTLGHTKGIIQFTSLNNQPALRQWLTVDFPVCQSKMRLSYVGDFQQANINGLKSHTYSHAFMVGFVKELYRISLSNAEKRPATLDAY